MATRRSLFLVAAVSALCTAAAIAYVRTTRTPPPPPVAAVTPPKETAARGNPVRGLALVNAFRDSLPSHSGNRLRCTSCHLDNGMRATAMSWNGAASKYPRYRARPGYEENLARRVNECIARSLAGRMLHEDGRDMRDIVAYIEALRATPRPPAVDSVQQPGDRVRGRVAFGVTCARCHGATGEGTALVPPVWGVDSYSIGAGMSRQFTLATFIRHNMPLDGLVTLTHQQAADIAAFVLAQPRQEHPGKERDWPNADAPVDVSYATDAARAAGKPLPPARPVLPRRVSPDSLTPR